MAKIIKPPGYSDDPADHDLPSIFLAGSIEMGDAPEWQGMIERAMTHDDWVIYNPRRDHWDSSWEQDISNPQFRQQVDWELDHLLAADVALFYFAPGCKSPVTMMELGLLAAKDPKKCVVVCPEGFWRRGNVQILCDRYGISVHDDLSDGFESIVGRPL